MNERGFENWNYFKSSWIYNYIATGLDKKDEIIKVATLLWVIGKEIFLISTFS